jgi:hypothetical protein
MERRIVTAGAIGGILGALVMAMFAMIAAATYQHTGFFTPLYHIASPIIGTDTMMRSMGTTYFSAGPALLGLIVHLAVGAVFGVIFALIASREPQPGPAVPRDGLHGIHGTSRSRPECCEAATWSVTWPPLVGWGTFSAEHAIYGLVLGAIWAARGVTVARVRASAEARA